MKKEKKSAILCLTVSLLFYIAALVSRFLSGNTSLPVLWICLGSTFLCLGAVQKNKQDKEKKPKK